MRYKEEGANEYREKSKQEDSEVSEIGKGDWIGTHCEEIETCLNKNNSKRIPAGERSNLREKG